MTSPKTAPGGSRQSSLGCATQRAVSIPKLHAEVKAALGISLMAEHEGDTVHGHVSGISNPNGLSLPCPMCDGSSPHNDCYEVVLYESPETPGKNHKTTVAVHGLDATGLARLGDVLRAHRP